MKNHEIGNMSPERESAKIKLPDNEEIIKKLEAKLKEYRKRYEYKAPEQIPLTERCKTDILEHLLNGGEVDAVFISQALRERYKDFDFQSFMDAFEIIKDYAETGGRNLRGGTGLKE